MNTMTAFSLFLLSLCVSLITGLVLLGWWMIARERSFQKRHAEQELAFRDAVRREAELSQRLQSALRQQVRYQQQLGRMETHYKERASLIRDLGIEPDRLAAGREALHGNLAFLRMRLGLLLGAAAETSQLCELARQHDALAAGLCRQLERTLSGRGGIEHDRETRRRVQTMLDPELMQRTLAESEQLIS